MLLPIRTDRPRIRPAYLTITLIVINTLVHIYSMVAPEVPQTFMVDGQAIQVSQPILIAHYALRGSDPTLLTFFTHMFIHGGIMHLVGNMLFLWIFGSLIEDALRPWGLAALYLGGGVMAALAHIGIAATLGHDVDRPMVGASGAVAAIMGLFMLRFYKTRVEIFYLFWYRWGTFWVQAVWALLYWIALEIFSGVLDAAVFGGNGGVAHWAHVGGFVAGAIAAPFLGSISAAKKEYFSDDPETNVEYVRRNEEVGAAERVLRADPGNAYHMRRLAQALSHAGEYGRATEVYQRCVYRFATRNMMGQAAEVFLEMIDHDDSAALTPELQLKLARQLEADHLPQAIAAYRTLAGSNVVRPEVEYALLRLSVLYDQKMNKPHEALRCLTEFLRRYPQSEWIAQARQAHAVLNGQLRLG